MADNVTATRKRICAFMILPVVIAAIMGCGRHEDEERSAARPSRRDIERLRSLPYVGGITARKDDPTGVVLLDREHTCPGYRLYTLQMLGRAELISVEGNVVRRWQYRSGDRWERAELLPNGDLLVVGMKDHGSRGGRPWRPRIKDSSRYLMRLDWDSRLVWKRKLRAHHDVELTPDGRLLVLTFKRRMEPGIHATIPTRDDYMTLLEQNGTVVDSRSLLESIRNSPEHFRLHTSKMTPSNAGGRPWIDLFHSNSVEWMHHENLFSIHPIYDPNNVLVCIRHQDRIAIVNWQEKKVVWSWGANQLSGPHDAQVLQDGHILLFDNGLSRGWSRALELDPLTNHIVWEYKADPPGSFYTGGKGSVQRLPNGNTLLAESDKGRAIEVTPDGSVVWEFICPYGVARFNRAAIVRIIHHSAEFVDKMLTASR